MLHFDPTLSHRRLTSLMASVAAAAALAACGGGGSSADPAAAAAAPAPAAPAPSPAPAAPAPAPAIGTALKGKFYGPAAAQVTLQNNGGDDLALTIPTVGTPTSPYEATPIAFATLLADGAAYSVGIKTKPAGQTCTVYQRATGTVLAAGLGVNVGCEFTDEHVVRSVDNSVRGSFFDSGAPAVGGSQEPIGTTTVAYGEGRFVVFVSSTAGLTPSTGTAGYRQVYWRDRLTGETTLISATVAGTAGNNDSFAPAISADGLTVVFESHANNLVAADTNGVRDVFVWSAQTPQGVARVSVGPGGIEANAESYEPTVSGDGRVIAFSSGASNLTPGVSGINTVNVYRRDLAAGTNTLITADSGGSGVGGSKPALSEDGNRLAFYSFAPTLVAGDTNGLWDIFVFDAATGQKTRVSLTSGGGERDQGTESASRVVAPAISGNGRHVAFATTATNMVPGDTNGAQDVFVVDTQTGAVVRASVAGSGAQGNADSPMGQGERVSLSHDGTWVGFSSLASNLGAGAGANGIGNALMHNRVTGQTLALTDRTTGSVGPVAITRTARYAVFGASNPLDDRFTSSGLFAHFTGVGLAFWWQVD